jgi:hypothetical protein
MEKQQRKMPAYAQICISMNLSLPPYSILVCIFCGATPRSGRAQARTARLSMRTTFASAA